jgi:hypothetical protein
MWWLPQTSGYSYSRVTAIQIDVHPAGKNPTNTPHASHAQSTYGSGPYVSHVVHIWQPCALSSAVMDRATAPEKKGAWQISQHDGWPIHGSIPNFSPEPAIEVVGGKPPSVDGILLGLPGPEAPACDRYIQYLLVRANPSVFNRLRWGLQPWRCRLATYHSLTFPIRCPHFPHKGPIRSLI